jgi:RimJ/RimL family protein N-acetyltransferase
MTQSPTDPFPRPAGRTVLRRLTPTDLADFQAYRHDPQVGRYQGWQPTSDAEALAFISDMSRAAPFQPDIWFQMGIADRETGQLIGDIGVCLADSGEQALIGFTLRAQSQGLGLASEAVGEAIRLIFERTPAEKVVGITDARNFASIRLLERLGMRRAETVKSIYRGEPCEEHIYILVRDDNPARIQHPATGI